MLLFSFDYTPYEKSLRGDPSLGLICNFPGCTYEGEPAPDSDEADERGRKSYSVGCMFAFATPLVLCTILFWIIAGLLLPWWWFALASVGAIALMVTAAWVGLRLGSDFRSRTHRTYICPECRRDSLIPLNSPRGQMLQTRNQVNATG